MEKYTDHMSVQRNNAQTIQTLEKILDTRYNTTSANGY